MPTERVEAFLQQVAGQLQWRAARGSICSELEEHIAEHTAELVEAGWDAAAAEEQAVAAMGDAAEIGQSLGRLHRPQLGWGVLVLALLLTAVAVGHQLYAEQWGYSLQMSTVLGFVLGLTLAAGLYFSDYSKWLKHSPALYGVAWLLVIFGRLFGVAVNGGYSYLRVFGRTMSIALLLMVLFVVAVAGMLYLWRQQGLAGLLACGILAVLSLPAMMAVHLGCALILGLAYVLLFLLVIHWGYFGAKRRSLAVVLGAVGLAAAGAVLYIITEPFRVSRLMDFWQLRQTGIGWVVLRLRETIQGARLIGPAGLTDSAASILTQDHTNYVFARLINDWGLLAGLGIVLVTALLLGVGGYYLHRVHHRYGRLLGVAVLALLGGQGALHILTNLGCFLPMDIQLPFLSAGGSNMLYSWLLLGILLSVWRRNNLLTEAEPWEEDGQQGEGERFVSYQEGKVSIDFGAIAPRRKKSRR